MPHKRHEDGSNMFGTGVYPLVPGPTFISPHVLKQYATNVGSPDLDPTFWQDHKKLVQLLQTVIGTTSPYVAIATGEGMVALWGAMKSIVKPGDAVISIVNGVFGDGFAEIAAQLGAKVHRLDYDWKEVIPLKDVISSIHKIQPKLVTLVHCETPSGMLNPLDGIGEAVAAASPDGLFLVDFVSSAGGCPVEVDKHNIDVGIFAPHKAFSAPPSLAFTCLSEKAKARVEQVDYCGYDALRPFLDAPAKQYLPYTANWHGVRATIAAVEALMEEGLDHVYQRHAEVSSHCRESGEKMGFKLYPSSGFSPTVTCFELPSDIPWDRIQAATREAGLQLGGSYGPLAGKVFRVGHMGTQADPCMVQEAMAVLEKVLIQLRK